MWYDNITWNKYLITDRREEKKITVNHMRAVLDRPTFCKEAAQSGESATGPTPALP